MNTKIKAVTLLFAVALMAVACNKTQSTSNRFIKAGEWKVTELSVDGTNADELPHWEIEDCEIYDESCHAEWANDEGGHAEFVWQFRDSGDTFEISRQAGEHDGHDHGHDHAEEEAIAQCYSFSGVYEVKERKKDMMEFTSTATLGNPGSTVVIKIEKM